LLFAALAPGRLQAGAPRRLLTPLLAAAVLDVALPLVVALLARMLVLPAAADVFVAAVAVPNGVAVAGVGMGRQCPPSLPPFKKDFEES
jgi:hypothetical protein